MEKTNGICEEENGIKKHMRSLMDKYRSLIGKDVKTVDIPFWDIVVITTPDEDQKRVFDAQIKDKYDRNEMPLGFDIHVFVDSPGPRVGSGGSTIYAVQFLENQYGADLYNSKVMLIHSGGFSKRIPSMSVLGKIFSSIPTDVGLYQMLDVKLAMFLPFLKRMPPGIFVACADDFVLYDIGDTPDDLLAFPETGFTAMAHPSPMELGTKHGVYVVEGVESLDPWALVQQCDGKEVLQKPSEERMFHAGAVLKGENHLFPGNIHIEGLAVYTDSSFFFGNDITRKLIAFLNQIGEITCEIDAYGDIIQAAGPKATIDYTKNTSNVSKVTSNLIPTREKVFHALKGSSVRLIVMNSSRYVHIGTLQEYIYHFCMESRFREEMNLNKHRWSELIHKDNNENNGYKKMKIRNNSNIGCVMYSVLPSSSSIPMDSIVEYCNIDVPVRIGKHTILSNCNLLRGELTTSQLKENNPPYVEIPSDIFLHTVPIVYDNSIKYATTMFHIDDNLKTDTQSNNASELQFLGKTVGQFYHSCGVNIAEYVPSGEMASLWTLPVCVVMNNMSESLLMSLNLHKAVAEGKVIQHFLDKDVVLVSMATILEMKDVHEMLRLRTKLFHRLSSSADK